MNDELELLRQWDADAAPLTEPARARARHRLLNAVAHPQRRPDGRPGRRRALRLATTMAVTMAVAGAAVLVATDGTDGTSDSPRMANASAVRVLTAAAARESENERTVAPRDDQFIYSKRIVKETERGTGTVKTYVAENWESVDGSQRSYTMELERVIWEEPLKEGEGVWPPQRWSELEKLPTEPEKLVRSIGSGTSSKPTDEFTGWDWYTAYFMLGALLQSPVLPEGLRPAAYEALALVPGVKAIDGVKDSAGRTGVGIAYTQRASEKGRYLIFAPDTYEFLGFRSERASASGDKTYIQLAHVAEWAIVDRLKQYP